MPESNARCQSASSLERPEARSASRASESRSSRVSYSGPISSSRRRRRWAASAGLRPPVPTATTRSAAPDHRHQRKRAVGRVVGAVHPDPAPPRPPRSTAAFTAGSSVAVSASHAPSRSAARNAPLGQRAAARPRPRPAPRHRRRAPRPRPRRRPGRAAARSCGRRSDRAPTTTTRRPRTSRFTGIAGEPRAGAAPRLTRLRSAGPFAAPVGAAPQLVEGQDLQLDREVDLAHRDAVGHRAAPPARS